MILAHNVPVALAARRLTINQDIKALVPKSKSVTGLYLWAALKVAERQLSCIARTAAHGTRKLDTPELLAFSVIRPNREELRACEVFVRAMRDSIDQMNSVRRCLEATFTLLLHRAFSGDLTAKWREAHMKELLQEMEHQAKTLAAAGHDERTEMLKTNGAH